MTKQVACIQSCYIPWKGYFDIIKQVDTFVILDSVQYTRRDWRNRNKIKTQAGPQWLTIPVQVKGKFLQSVWDTKVDTSTEWTKKHWKTIQQNYTKAPFFKEYADVIAGLYEKVRTEESLSVVNITFLQTLCSLLEIETEIVGDRDIEIPSVTDPTERLALLCEAVSGTTYLSGPSAQAYLDTTLFSKRGIEVAYMSYDNYPEYDQLYPPFTHGISVLDLLFSVGSNAKKYLVRS